MTQPDSNIVNDTQEGLITEYIENSSGLNLELTIEGELKVSQSVDGKSIKISPEKVEDVLERLDSQGQNFLQVNFKGGKKILLTEKLIGFKPAAAKDLDLSRLPKVVTTPDLISVVEAIEETVNGEISHKQELELLRKVFNAVLDGGESIGFDLSTERAWLKCIVTLQHKPSA